MSTIQYQLDLKPFTNWIVYLEALKTTQKQFPHVLITQYDTPSTLIVVRTEEEMKQFCTELNKNYAKSC